MKYFILLTTATTMIETVSFSQLHSNLLLRRQISLTQLCNLSILTPQKMWSQTKILIKKSCYKVLSSTQLLRTQTKCIKNYFFWIFTNVCHITWCVWFFQECFIFLKTAWWPVWTVWAKDFLKGILLSCIICVLLNAQLFLRNISRWLLQWVNVHDQEF